MLYREYMIYQTASTFGGFSMNGLFENDSENILVEVIMEKNE